MTSSGIAISPIDVDPADQGYVPTPAENWAGNMMGPVPCFTCDAVQRMTADERKAFAGISATALLGGYGLVQLGTEVAAVSIVGVDTLYATGSASAACAAVCDRVAGLLNTAAETAGGVPPGALMGGRPIPLSELSGEQASNFARFEKALPRNVSSLGASRFENGTVQFWASVRAASPRWANASATYVKIIDETGTTIGYYKATVRQSGAATELKQKYP